MRDLIEKATIEFFKQNSPEGFSENNDNKKIELIASIVSLVIVQIILLFLGQWLWNDFLVPAINFAQPIESIWQLLAISVLIKLLLN